MRRKEGNRLIITTNRRHSFQGWKKFSLSLSRVSHKEFRSKCTNFSFPSCTFYLVPSSSNLAGNSRARGTRVSTSVKRVHSNETSFRSSVGYIKGARGRRVFYIPSRFSVRPILETMMTRGNFRFSKFLESRTRDS